MNKRIVPQNDLHQPMVDAMTEIAAVVKKTLGPGGRNILIQRIGQALDGTPLGPKITKDGVSVAEECSTSDPIKDVVMQAIKSICRKTNVDAGDGTTSAIVLGEAILNETIHALEEDPTLNPQLVKESIECSMQMVVKELRRLATPVHDMDLVESVATVSANGDREIGKIIGDAFRHVGAEGVVTVDEGSGPQTTLELVDGYQFNKGAEARNVFFNNKELTQFEAENCAILIYDGKLVSHTDVLPALQLLAQANPKNVPPVLFIANEFSPGFLQWLLYQKNEAGFKCCAVTGPHVTHVRTGYYDDIAVYTGGTRLGNGARNTGAMEVEDFGLVKKVIVTKYKTTLYDGQGSEEDVLTRVEQLKAAKAEAESPYDVQVLNDRIAAITNGIAKIGVGGVTEFEVKEKYDRIEDALNAARAAIQEGIVPGGGTTLLRISDKFKASTNIGDQVMYHALRAPFYQILENLGIDESTQIGYASQIISSRTQVFDARNKKFSSAMKSGIIDPVKVTRTALENAVSISSLLCTSGGAIIYVPETK